MEQANWLSKAQAMELADAFTQDKSIIKISTHGDADGCTSACLLKKVLKKPVSVSIPREFGSWEEGTVFMLDMKPKGDYTGICIDHHPDHPEERKYSLIWDTVPTSLIVYKLFPIPDEEKWKVVVGLVGDGTPQLVPPEVFKLCPELLRRTYSIYPRLGESSLYHYPIWLMISSGINALCKTRQEDLAFSILDNASSPMELLRNSAASEAKEILKEAVNTWLRDGNYLTIGEILIGEIDSEYGIEKDIATRLSEQTHFTTLIINHRTKGVSIRGILSTLLYQMFKDNTILEIGGHPGFMGATLKGEIKDIIERIRREIPI